MKLFFAAFLLLLTLTIGTLIWRNALGAPDLPQTGYLELSLPVAHRDVPLKVQIWYPVTSVTPPTTVIGRSALFWGFVTDADQPPTPGPHPVIVFSHGSGGKAQRHLWLLTRLAAAGYIVIATDHPGSTSGDSDASRTLRLWDRTRDISAMIDLLANTPPGGLQPDLRHVTAMGFSMGGFSALASGGVRAAKAAMIQYCAAAPDQPDCLWYAQNNVNFEAIDQPLFDQSNRDIRITAVIGIDPALPRVVTADSLQALTVPTLILNLGTTATLPTGMNWSTNMAQNPAMTYDQVAGATHFSAMDDCRFLGWLIIGLASPDAICARSNRPRIDIQAELWSKISAFLAQHGH